MLSDNLDKASHLRADGEAPAAHPADDPPEHADTGRVAAAAAQNAMTEPRRFQPSWTGEAGPGRITRAPAN